jgi:hypothetical protein
LAWIAEPEDVLGARRAEVGDWGRDQAFDVEEEVAVAEVDDG